MIADKNEKVEKVVERQDLWVLTGECVRFEA